MRSPLMKQLRVNVINQPKILHEIYRLMLKIFMLPPTDL
jgi:hypothetical protein